MAEKEHLEILVSSVIRWNKWRRENPDVMPMLSKVDLDGADLASMNLNKADLSGANLKRADLNRADLSDTDLRLANLSEADLSEVDLSGADLSGETILHGVDLRGANLESADLSGTDLTRSNLSGADLSSAVLSNADLSGANLSEANLREADLSGVDLRKSDLSSADLSGAVLSEVDLGGADLSRANLAGAYLCGADCSRANLTMADLSRADLSCAYLKQTVLSESDLSDADLRGAVITRSELFEASLTRVQLGGTLIIDSDLSSCSGLATASHTAPSTMTIDTVYRSDGNIPRPFLRGVGIPESLILHLEASSTTTRSNPSQFRSYFLNYSERDVTFVIRLHDALQERGVRCWLKEGRVRPDSFSCDQEIGANKHWVKQLFCCSVHSLNSRWFEPEVEREIEIEHRLSVDRDKKSLTLLTINLDGHLNSGWCTSSVEPQVRLRLAADFAGWDKDDSIFDAEFERLLKAL